MRKIVEQKGLYKCMNACGNTLADKPILELGTPLPCHIEPLILGAGNSVITCNGKESPVLKPHLLHLSQTGKLISSSLHHLPCRFSQLTMDNHCLHAWQKRTYPTTTSIKHGIQHRTYTVLNHIDVISTSHSGTSNSV